MTDLVQRLRLPKSATGYISRETLMAERLAAADEIEFLRRALDAALAEIRSLTPSPKKAVRRARQRHEEDAAHGTRKGQTP